MNHTFRRKGVLYLLLPVLLFLFGCGGNESPSPGSSAESPKIPEQHRTSISQYLLPEASGTLTYEDADAGIYLDASHLEEGYLCVRYQGEAEKVKLKLTYPDNTEYIYPIKQGSNEFFPLTGGDGTYEADVLEHVVDSKYAVAFSQDLSVRLADEFRPYLYPNQYSWFTQDSPAMAFAKTLSDQSEGDLDYVGKVYNYVIENITYDTEAAKNIPYDYIPDVEITFSSGKGICFDYASLMSAMLRSQGIPTKLVVGYSGEAYHAWISVYIKEIGWVDQVIQFDGEHWSLMDPTLAANNESSAVREYIGNGKNYTVKYCY